MSLISKALKMIADWCGLCYRGLKTKGQCHYLLCNFKSGCLSQSGDSGSNGDRSGGTVRLKFYGITVM